MKAPEFRKELMKIMPGYRWTVQRSTFTSYISATGIQSSGFNRLSTLHVIRRTKDDNVKYEVKSSGYGKNAPWLSEYTGGTLARALRGLQSHYEIMAQNYGSHASALKYARKPENG